MLGPVLDLISRIQVFVFPKFSTYIGLPEWLPKNSYCVSVLFMFVIMISCQKLVKMKETIDIQISKLNLSLLANNKE